LSTPKIQVTGIGFVGIMYKKSTVLKGAFFIQ